MAPKTGATRYQKFLKSEKSKTKLKSKELPKGTNVTKTNFKVKKIVIREQLKGHGQDEPVSKKKLNLKELLTRLNHFNVNSKTEALNGIRELVMIHTQVLEHNLGQLLYGVTPLLLNIDKIVRREALKVLHLILSNAPPDKMAPFFDIVCTYLRCTMTHINTQIQEDSLLFLDVLLLCNPERVAFYFYKIIPNFIDMISKLRVDSRPGRTLTVNLSSQLTSAKWRVKVLHRLQELLHQFVSLNMIKRKNCNGPIFQYFYEQKLKHYTLWDTNAVANCHLQCFDPKSSQSDGHTEDDVENFKKYLDTLLPLLFETWLEVCPNATNKSDLNTEIIISEEAASLLKHLLEVVNLLWQYVEILNTINPSSDIIKWFCSKFRKAYNRHIVSGFPYNTIIRSSRDSHSTSEVFVDAIVDPKMVNENLKICNTYVCLNSKVNIKDHSTEVVGVVLDYVEKVFSQNKEDNNNSAIMKVLNSLFATESSAWSKNPLIDLLFDKIVFAYFNNKSTTQFHQDIFTLLCKISLDDQLARFYKTPTYKQWISNLPDILCCESITTPAINILQKFATHNNKTFNTIMKPKLHSILNNLPTIKIIGTNDNCDHKNKLLCLLYWIYGWDNESLNLLENQLRNNVYGHARSKFIVDMLKLKSVGVFK